MSVLIPELPVFEAVFNKINKFKFNKESNIDYCQTFRNMTENQCTFFVQNLLKLNELSYIKRYPEDLDQEQEVNLYQCLIFNKEFKSISTLQLLKYLQAIKYNIEIETIKFGYSGLEENEIPKALINSYNTLKQAIKELQLTVITYLTNYSKLKYCTV